MRKLLYAGLAVVGGMALGLASAINQLNQAGESPVVGSENWIELDPAAANSVLPYSLGRFLGSGQVPPSFSIRQFTRLRDEDGNALRGDCAYVLEGRIPAGRWWTLAATDGDGRVVSSNSVVVSGQVFRNAEGVVRVSFAPWPVSGNWVKVDSGTYQLVLALHDSLDEEDKPVTLPVVRKGSC